MLNFKSAFTKASGWRKATRREAANISEDKLTTYFSRMQNESYRAYLDMMVLNLPRPKRVKVPIPVLGAANDTLLSLGEIEAMGWAYDTQAEIFPVALV
jgi:hypothetical protein